MAEETIGLKIIGSKTLSKGALAKDILEVAEADYKTVLRGIAANEIADQLAIGNKPTHLIVDGREARSVTEADYSVIALFVDAKSMLDALNDVWRELHRAARHVTGRSVSQFEIWSAHKTPRAHKVGNSPSAITAQSIDISTALYVAGPMVPHVRKFQWYFGPSGPQRFRRSRAKVFKNRKARDKPKVAYTIHQLAARAVQRKYRWLMITDAWIDTPNQNPRGKMIVNRVPAVMIMGRNKGALH